MRPAIVLSGHTMGLGVARALGEQGVPVVVVHYDARDMAHLSRYVVAEFSAPHPEQHPEEFLGLLTRCAERFGGGVIIPASDEALVAASLHKRQLEERFIVACPDWSVVQQCIDKQRTYALAEAHGVACPRTLVPRSREELECYAANAAYPCLVKPSQSHRFYERFRCKMIRVESSGALLTACAQAEAAGLEVMLQEIIPGGDDQVVNYNAYADAGEVLTEFTAAHVRNAPPSFGSPRVVLSRAIPEVLTPGRTLLQALGYSGYACTEFKRDARDGRYKLMEINARHNLSTLLAVRCGLNFPWLEYRHRTAGELPAASDYRQGLYWIDITRDLGYSAGYCRQERYTAADYLRPYLHPHVFAIFDRKDLRPFVRRVAYLAQEGFAALFGRRKTGQTSTSTIIRA